MLGRHALKEAPCSRGFWLSTTNVRRHPARAEEDGSSRAVTKEQRASSKGPILVDDADNALEGEKAAVAAMERQAQEEEDDLDKTFLNILNEVGDGVSKIKTGGVSRGQ